MKTQKEILVHGAKIDLETIRCKEQNIDSVLDIIGEIRAQMPSETIAVFAKLYELFGVTYVGDLCCGPMCEVEANAKGLTARKYSAVCYIKPDEDPEEVWGLYMVQLRETQARQAARAATRQGNLRGWSIEITEADIYAALCDAPRPDETSNDDNDDNNTGAAPAAMAVAPVAEKEEKKMTKSKKLPMGEGLLTALTNRRNVGDARAAATIDHYMDDLTPILATERSYLTQTLWAFIHEQQAKLDRLRAKAASCPKDFSAAMGIAWAERNLRDATAELNIISAMPG